MKYSVTSLSDSGEDAKVKGTRKVGGAGKKGKRNRPFSPHFPLVLFLCSAFSIQRARLSRSLEQATLNITPKSLARCLFVSVIGVNSI